VIVTKTPLRLTLGGGGTDLPSFYSRYGGLVVTTAIDKFVYLIVKKMFEDKIRVSYSKTEIVADHKRIQHPLVREALELLGMSRNLEIVSIADIPSNTGLGSSGSFTVGLLHALHVYKGDSIIKEMLAEEACKIQIEMLKEPEGKQDPYIAAFGGVISLEIARDGRVEAKPIMIRDEALRELQNSLLFFYTGIKRDSGSVLRSQQASVKKDDSAVVESMLRIKSIGGKVRSALEKGDIEEFGRLQHEHWQAKKLAAPASNAKIDRWCRLGMEAGALGEKLLGAGGGGFIMFCSTNGRDKVRKAMAKEGLREVEFRMSADGSKAMVNL
jgi:D-glycero-alpha-D-manno-heptose-7-phosphate kinase